MIFMVRKIDFVVKSFSKVWFFYIIKIYIIRLDNQNLKIQSSYKYKSLSSNKWSCNQILLDQLAALPTLGMPVDSFLLSLCIHLESCTTYLSRTVNPWYRLQFIKWVLKTAQTSRCCKETS